MQQAPSGQRINTDSCVVAVLIGNGASPKKVLDIGAGTGVVSLFLAARFPDADIVAIEPEESIAAVARLNMVRSPWSVRLAVHCKRAQDVNESTFGRFDFVVCNPPYFHKSTPSNDFLRQIARHTTTLQPAEVFAAFDRVMTLGGTAWLSCPSLSEGEWLALGQSAGLSCFERVLVYDHPDAAAHITIQGWSRSYCEHPGTRKVYYRSERQGGPSAWMKEFRAAWFPSRYNKHVKGENNGT